MKYSLRTIIVLSLIATVSQVNAQLCNNSGKGNSMPRDQSMLCAPSTVSWNVYYFGLDDSRTNEIVINWGDGSAVQIATLVCTNPTAAVHLQRFDATVSHTYPKGDGECIYNASVELRVDGTICEDENDQNQDVIVWDTDDVLGVGLETDVTEYRVCAGNSTTVDFTDITQFTCLATDHSYNVGRWVQWEYGTVNTISGSVLIDAVSRTFPYQETPVRLPKTALSSGVASLNISVPNTSVTGELFEVTLNNWNSCNPYEDEFGNLTGNPPVSTTVYIRIVDAPVADFTYDINPACVGNPIQFTNNSTAGFQYSWDFDDGTISTDANPTKSFTLPGTYAVTLTVTDNVIVGNTGTCQTTISKNIEVLPQPIADFSITPNTPQCKNTNVNLTNTSTNVPPGTNWEWEIRKSSSSGQRVDVNGNDISGSAAATENITTNLPYFGTAPTATYFVQLTSNTPNSCTNSSAWKTIEVKSDVAVPTFSSPVLSRCQGSGTTQYTASAINADNYLWNLTPAAAGTIDASGEVTWNASFSGTATVEVTAQGCGTDQSASIGVAITSAVGNPSAIGGDNAVCQGTASGVYTTSAASATSYAWSITGAGNTISGTSSSATVNWSPTFVGTATITVVAQGCSGVSTPYSIDVDVDPTPQLSNPASDYAVTICPGGTAEFIPTATLAGSSFRWTTTVVGSITGVTSTGTNQTIGTDEISDVLSNSGNSVGMVTYHITPYINACDGATRDFVVTVNPDTPENAGSITGTNEVCEEATGINFSVPTIARATAYIWTLPAGATIVSGNNTNSISVDFGSTAPGSYSITAYGSNSCGNGGSSSLNVTVKPEPTLTATTVDTDLCHNDEAVVSLSSDIVGTLFSWQVLSKGADISGESNVANTNAAELRQQLFNSGTTTQTLTYRITPNYDGCEGDATDVTFTVHPSPDVIISPAAVSLCNGDDTDITLSGGVSGTTYTWVTTISDPSLTGASNGSGTIIQQTLNNSSLSPQTVRYSVTPAANGCFGPTEDIIITVQPTPVLSTTTAASTICSEDDTNISLSSNVAGTTYSWTVVSSSSGLTGGFAASGSLIQQTLENSTTSAQTITYTITPNISGCDGVSEDVTITVNPKPSLTATATATELCSTETTDINLTSNVSGTTFTWTTTVSDPGQLSGASAGTGNSILQTLTNSSNIVQTVTYQISTEANSCAGETQDVIISVYPTPIITLTPVSTTICSGENAQVNFSSSVSGTTYTWTVANSNPANLSGAFSNSGNSINQTLTNTGTTPEQITYQVTPTINGCDGPSEDIVITVSPATRSANAGANDAICGLTYTMTATPPSVGTGMWIKESGPGTVSFADPTNANTTATVDVFGIYTFRWTLTNGSCGSDFAFVSVDFKDDPNTSNITGQTNVCVNSQNILYEVDFHAGSTYSWTITPTTNAPVVRIGGGISDNFISLDFGPTPWVGEIIVSETNNGCTSPTERLTINSYQLPNAHAGADQTLCEGSSAILGDSPSATGGSGSYTYLWSPSIGLDDATLANPTSTPPFTRTYTLVVTDASTGCVSMQDQVTITVQPQLQAGSINGTQTICAGTVPTTFTQNPASGGDGSYLYQWEKSTDGGTTYLDIAGAVSSSYQETSSLTTTTYYRRKVTSGVCGEVITSPILVTVEPILVAGTIGSDQTIVSGTTPANLNSVVDGTGGPGLQYQWQKATGTGTNYTNIPGANSSEYQPGPLSITTFFRRVASEGVCTPVESNIVTITVESASEAGTIEDDQVVCVNTIPAPITEDNPASGGAGTYTYRWLFSEDGANFTIIVGESGTDFTPTNPISVTTYYKREVQSGVSPWVSSNIITVDVEQVPNGGIITGSQTICANDNPTIFLESTPASGGSGSYTYQWKSSSTVGGPYADIPLATNKLYDVPTGLSNTTYFVREVSSGVCGSTLSNEITVTVQPALTAGEVVGNQTICEGSSVSSFTETIAANGGSGTYSYQWKSSLNFGGPFIDIAGADQPTYTVPGSLAQTTYYLREVSSGQCSDQTSNVITVTVEPTLTAGQIGGSSHICEGDATAAFTSVTNPAGGNGIYNYQWKSSSTPGGPYAVIPGATNATYQAPDGPSVTMYYIREVQSGQCAAVVSNEVSITVDPTLNPGSIGSDQSIVLAGDPSTFTEFVSPSGGAGAGSYGFQWQASPGSSNNFSDISGATSNVYDVPAGLIQTTYYRRRVASGVCGVAYSDTVEVTVQSTLEAGTIGNNQVICEGSIPDDLVEITAASGGSGAYTYQWKSSTDKNSLFADIPGATNEYLTLSSPLNDTTYYIRVVSSGAYAPIETDTVVIIVQPLLTAGTVANVGTDEICVGEQAGNFAESVSPEGGDGVYEYQWLSREISAASFQEIPGATSPNYQSPAGLSSTTYYQRRVRSGQCTEVFSNELIVTVNPLPTVSLTSSVPTNTICQGTEVTFTAAGADEYEFFVNGTSVQGPSSNSSYQTDTLVHLDEVHVRGIDANNCTALSSPITTVVNELPTATISGSADMCIDEQISLFFNMTGKLPFEVIYTDGTNLFTLTDQSFEGLVNVRPTESTTYSLVSVKDANGCFQNITGQEAVVNVGNPIAQFSIEGDAAACGPYSVKFINEQVQAGVTYTWAWGDGTEDTVTTAADSAVIEHTFFNFNSSRDMTYQVTLIASHDEIGCTDRATTRVKIYSSPEVRIDQSTDEGCGPLPVSFTNNSFGVTAHRWYYREKGTTEVLEQVASKSVDYVLPNATTETITYEVVYEASATECSAEPAVFEVVVHPELSPLFTATPTQLLLPNATITIVNQTNEGDWEYSWDFGDGTTSSDKNPGEHTYTSPGQFNITLTVSNEECEQQHEELVVVDIDSNLPFIDFSAENNIGCGPLEVTFNNLSNFVDPATYQWNFGDGTSAMGVEHPVHLYDKAGKYSVKLEATSIYGEQQSLLKEFFVEVYAQPRASFTAGPPVVYLPERPIGTINQSIGATVYEWHFGDGSVSNEFEPTHTYTEEGVYDIMLIASNEQGCSDTLLIERMVSAKQAEATKPRVPNSFTPNPLAPNGGHYQYGDVSNDIFIPVIEGVTEMSMTIYNRWGNVMFTSQNKNVGWDGYYQGKLCPADVYYYKIEMKFSNGERRTEHGDVTLIR